MDAQSLALSILQAGNLPIPGEVAAELLSMVPTEKIPNSLLNFGEFSGEAAVFAAKSSPQKAKLVAGNTTDVRIQRALLGTLHVRDIALDAMLQNKKVSDPDLLVELHKQVWEEQASNHAYSRSREAIATCAPLRCILDFLATTPGLRGYPMHAVGARIGTELASGELWPLEYLDKISEAQSSSKDPREFENLLSQVGRTLAYSSGPEDLVEVLRATESRISARLVDIVAMAVLAGAKVVDKALLEFFLKYLPTPELFHEFQLRSASSHYAGTPPVAPRELLRRDPPYTFEALCRLAEVHPGALFEVLSGLHADSDHRSEIIDLALDSGLSVLAHALLGKNTTMGARSNVSVLSPEQFHLALEVFENGTFVDKQPRRKPEISSFAAARAIPRGAAVEDVVRMFRLCSNAAEAFAHLYSMGPSWEAITYQPTVKDVRILVESLDVTARHALVCSMLGMWSDHSHPNTTRRRPKGFESVVSVIMDSVPAATLAAESGAPSYVAHVFTQAFGSDTEKWRHGLGLLPTATVPLSKVVSATKRLNR